LISFVTINFLWFYSAMYKRRIFVGNLIVAFLIGIVPLYVLIYNLPSTAGQYFPSFITKEISILTYEVVFIVSTIAFVINLMREIIKDIADIRGDMHLAAKTVPIVMGIRQSKLILTLLLIPLLFLMAYFVLGMEPILRYHAHFNLFSILIMSSGLTCVFAFVFLFSANKRKNYLIASNLLKVAMLFGIISPLLL
ncbi:MAG: UbiA family prenyltransferase, partial [Crocinitomicaceae bacterium]